MESNDSLKTEAVKVVCSSTKVQKLFKREFRLVVPSFASLLAHLLKMHIAINPQC